MILKLTLSDFEPPSEDRVRLDSDARALDNYETYVRDQLPGLVRSTIEVAMMNATQPLEEALRGQLIEIVRACQDDVFQHYRAITSQHSILPSPLLHTTGPLGTVQLDRTSISTPGLQGSAAHVAPGSASELDPEFVPCEMEGLDCRMIEYPDSGYGSVSPSIFQESTDEERVGSSRVIPWAYGPEDIQDAIYPRYYASKAPVSIQCRRVLLSSETRSLLDRVMKGFWSTIFDRR